MEAPIEIIEIDDKHIPMIYQLCPYVPMISHHKHGEGRGEVAPPASDNSSGARDGAPMAVPSTGAPGAPWKSTAGSMGDLQDPKMEVYFWYHISGHMNWWYIP